MAPNLRFIGRLRLSEKSFEIGPGLQIGQCHTAHLSHGVAVELGRRFVGFEQRPGARMKHPHGLRMILKQEPKFLIVVS